MPNSKIEDLMGNNQQGCLASAVRTGQCTGCLHGKCSKEWYVDVTGRKLFLKCFVKRFGSLEACYIMVFESRVTLMDFLIRSLRLCGKCQHVWLADDKWYGTCYALYGILYGCYSLTAGDVMLRFP